MEYYDDLEQNQVNEPTTDKFSQAFSKYNMNVDSAWVKSVIEKAKKEILSGGDKEALGTGPSLMFVTLPKVFNSMQGGAIIGALFFFLVLFAAITSSVSIMEAIVSGIIDRFNISRLKATLIVAVYGILLGIACSFGFGIWSNVKLFGFDILDFLDFVSNSVLLPLVGMLTCIVVGFVIKPKTVIEEIELNGPFKMKGFYTVMVKWVAPIFIFAILVSSILQGLGVLTI